jgi:hypothetical protein
MARILPAVVAFLFSLAFSLSAQEAAEKPLSDADAYKAIDDILLRAKQIVRVQAELKTSKTGILKDGKISVAYETVKYEAPDRIWWQNRGETEGKAKGEDCSLVLMADGFFWEIEPQFGADPRKATRRKAKVLAKEGKTVNLAAFLIGSDVQSSKEIRDKFDLTAASENEGTDAASYRFFLKPKEEGPTVELWIRPGEALPWKVKTIEKKKVVTVGAPADAPPKFKMHEEVRELRDVKTNLTGLAPFPTETFLFPYEKGMEVTDEDAAQALSAEAIRKANDELKAKIEAERKDAGGSKAE